jgi:uncharacterized damage-inducible protein DinB
MSDVLKIRDYLFEELALAVRTTKNLLAKMEADQWNYQPKENMRTFAELAHHLVSIPASDLACLLQEKGQADYVQIEKELEAIKDGETLGAKMEENFGHLKEYVTSLSEEDLMNKVTKPFYFEEGGNVQIRWLMEIVTHAFHHRAQLFNYMKELGHDINMFDLY